MPHQVFTPTSAELVVNARCRTGESPVWQADEQVLYWVDIPAGELHAWHWLGARHDHWSFDQQLGCIARLPSGDWLGGMQDGIYRLSPGQPSSSVKLVGVEHARPGMRFNDGRCDRQGRFWAGTMLEGPEAGAPAGALYRLQMQGETVQLDRMLDDFITPNGLAFSPDGRTMYLSDSHPQRKHVWAFDYDIDTGVPSRRRVFIEALPAGRPDGAAIDVDGCYWIAGNDAGLIHRYTPDGRLDRSLQVPVAKPSMCAFGGPRMDVLFVTSIRLDGAEPDALDGSVFALYPGVQGMKEPGVSIASEGVAP